MLENIFLRVSTEVATIHNLSHGSRFIEEPKNIGSRFALDDVGSGLSSFAYLEHLLGAFGTIDSSVARNMRR